MLWIDRLVCRFGGRRLVEARAGIGHLCWEIIPAFIWTQLTGAMGGEVFYFVTYLQLLGASEANLGYLQLVVFASGLVQLPLVMRSHPHDLRRSSVITSFFGRLFWFGTVLWPLAGYFFGWSTRVILIGVFASVFLSQVICYMSNAAFASWTQQIVPRHLRGAFYAYRMVSSITVLVGVLWVVSRCLSSQFARDDGQLYALMWLQAGATAVCMLGMLGLRRAPEVHVHERLTAYRPLMPQLRANKALVPLLAWWCLTNASAGISLVYQTMLYKQAGTQTADYLTWQSWSQYPCMLLAILAATWALPRVHARPLLIATHVLFIIGESGLLLLSPPRLHWMLPVLVAIGGVARGAMTVSLIARQQEILPAGDPRFYAVFIAMGNAVGLLVTLRLPVLFAWCDHWHARHPGSVTAAWMLVAIGVGIRLIATPLLLGADAPHAGASPKDRPAEPLRDAMPAASAA